MTMETVTTVPTVRLSRILPARPEDVFNAWLDAKGMRAWMCPGDIIETRAEIDARVGGKFRIVMRGPENTYELSGEYVEIDPPRRLSFTWEANVTDGVSLVTLEFHEHNNGCELVLTHERAQDVDTAANYEKGWSSILERLADRMAA